ncbi:MAG: hypothetical protein AAF318_13615 [Pseudomonadota bacterium]
MSAPLTTSTLTLGGAADGDAVTGRANIFEMTAAAEEAVLAPADVGAFPHDMRAALAARMARLNGDEAAAAHYEARMEGPAHAALADPSHPGEGPLLAFVDKTAAAPKDIVAADIKTLQAAGVSDADIVRLCELIAFMAYQLRVIAGLRLMGQTA